jgi:CRP-like cAMP-binding protein
MGTAADRTLLTDGHVVFREGQPASKIYLITQGEVELIKATEKGLKTITTCVSGDFIGTNALIDNEKYFATAKVKKAATIIPVEKELVTANLSKLDKLTLNVVKSVILRSNRLMDEK